MGTSVIRASLFLSVIGLTGQAVAACDETILLEYQVNDGRYQFELNDVYLDSGAAQSSSGGIPLKDWLLNGENTISVQMNAQTGEFSVYAICADGSGKRDMDAVSLAGQASHNLKFDAPDPPKHIYLAAKPTDDEGLLEAVETLKSATTARDYDAVWRMHAAMRADMELTGQPLKAAAYQMGKIVENISPEFAPDLQTNSVLGGRVWEVFGKDFAPPIHDVVTANGGKIDFKTGSFWMKMDGVWSVFRR